MKDRVQGQLGKPDRTLCFRHENRFLPQHEWDKIDAPAMERRLNFHPEQVKLVKDMDSHITYFYRIKPEIDNL